MSPTSPRQPAARAPAPPSKLHRDSHLIQKKSSSSSSPPSSSSTTNSSVSSSSSPGNHHHQQPRPPPRPNKHPPPPPPPQQQQPVIIYTHSPKVIRTSPRDFMSIVQKLTGLDSASASANSASAAAQDEHSSSSSTDSCGANGPGSAAPAHYVAGPQQLMMPPPAPALDHARFAMPPDIPPLFAPAGDPQLLCASSRGLYGHFPMVDAANMQDAGPTFSPAMVETMRTTFPDYQLT